VAVSAVAAAVNVLALFVVPQNTELGMIRSQVEVIPDSATRIGFVRTGWGSGMRGVVRYDEFGVASSMQPWTLEPAVLLVLREEGRLGPPGTRPQVKLLPWDTARVTGGLPVVDVRDLGGLP